MDTCTSENESLKSLSTTSYSICLNNQVYQNDSDASSLIVPITPLLNKDDEISNITEIQNSDSNVDNINNSASNFGNHEECLASLDDHKTITNIDNSEQTFSFEPHSGNHFQNVNNICYENYFKSDQNLVNENSTEIFSNNNSLESKEPCNGLYPSNSNEDSSRIILKSPLNTDPGYKVDHSESNENIYSTFHSTTDLCESFNIFSSLTTTAIELNKIKDNFEDNHAYNKYQNFETLNKESLRPELEITLSKNSSKHDNKKSQIKLCSEKVEFGYFEQSTNLESGKYKNEDYINEESKIVGLMNNSYRENVPLNKEEISLNLGIQNNVIESNDLNLSCPEDNIINEIQENTNKISEKIFDDCINSTSEQKNITKDTNAYSKISENSEENEPVNFSENFSETVKEINDIFSNTLKDDFEWDHYLEETSSEAAPPTAFVHVERSLETGVKEGQFLEVLFSENKKDNEQDLIGNESRWVSFWPAKVISSCGSLLRLRYIISANKSTISNLEFWREISSPSLKPVGFSLCQNIPMVVPPTITSDNEDIIVDETSLENLEAAPEESLRGTGIKVASWIIEGSLLEVLDVDSPYEGSVFKVTKNIGGRLLLTSAESGSLESQSLWVFFLDIRIKPLGWINQQGHPFRYKSESSLELLKTSPESSTERALSFISSYHPPLTKHFLELGTCLETILPTTKRGIYVARVSRIIDEIYFEVCVNDLKWVTWIGDPYIMPPKFSEELYLDLIFPNDFTGKPNWEEYLASTGYKAAPREPFLQHTLAAELGFEEGQKLEAVSPSDPGRVCIATVERVLHHLLLLKLDFCTDSFFFRASSSAEIFPVGWTQSNLSSLSISSLYVPSDRNIKAHKSKINVSEEDSSPPKRLCSESPTKSISNSMWCPRLFINHFCYPGPYLSKSKVAKMSRSVGPGPVPLVLRDVISMTINAGYIPTRVLRELQGLRGRNSSWQSIPMKAKFKRHILKAGVNIPSAAREIEDFLLEFSKILISCRNMWSHDPLGENCPLICNGQSLTLIPNGAAIFRGRGARGSMARRKKGGKKRLFYPIKSSAVASDDPVEEDGEPDEVEDVEDTVSGSEGESRPTSPISTDTLRKPKPKRSQIYADLSSGNKPSLEFSKERGTKRSKEENEPQLDPRGIHRRKRPREEGEKSELVNAIFGLEPAVVKSDPLEWSVDDVEEFVLNQADVCHQAAILKEQEVDGRALLLLNLPSLIYHLGLPRDDAVTLAQHICKIKLAHFLYFYPEAEEL